MAKVKDYLWQEPELDLELIQVNDMHISKMSSSKYVKKDDVEKPILVKIYKIDQQDVSMEGQAPSRKWIMHFSNHDKPLVLNQTNIELAAIALGSENTDDWITKEIVLFNDPTIMFGGRVTGGVRIRAPKKAAQSAEQSAEPDTTFDDELDF